MPAEAILNACKLFARVTEPSRSTLLDMAVIRRFPAGETIFRQGDPCPGLFLVGTGLVRIFMLAPTGKPVLSEKEDRLKFGTYKYKIYHPDFPHEPTSDQFFDEIQWEAYYQLGQYIGADVLGVTDLEQYADHSAPEISVDQLIAWFDRQENPLVMPFKPRGMVAPEYSTDGLESIGGEEPTTATPPTVAAEDVKYQM